MVAAAQHVSAGFGGEAVPLISQEPVWFVVKVDSNLYAEFRLYHKDAGRQHWQGIASGKGSMSVRIDQAVADLHLDTLGWIILCSPLNEGTWPVYVQLFQGTDATGFKPITRIAQYNASVGASNALHPIDDTISIR